MNRKLLAFGILMCAFAVVACSKLKTAKKVKFLDCGNGKKSSLASVSTESEVQGNTIILKKGTNVIVYFDFTMKSKSATAVSVVHGIIAGIPVPFTPPNPNACLNSNLTCPIVPGKGYRYKAVIPVKSFYPNDRLVVEWELRTEAGDKQADDIWCAKIAAEIES